MPRRGSPSPRDYYRDYNRSGSRTPRRGPGSVASYSSYDSEDEEGPTLFGSILRTIMAGSAVVAIAILVRRPAPRAPPIASMARTGASAAFASAFARLDPRARVPPGPPPRPFISFPPSAFSRHPTRRDVLNSALTPQTPPDSIDPSAQAKIERDQRDGNGFRSRAGSASASSRPKPHRIPATPPHSDRSHSHPKPHRSHAPPPRPLPPPPLSAHAPIGAAPTTTTNGALLKTADAVADLGPVPGGYVVKEGDCLYRIAVQHGVDPGVVERLNPELAARANNIKVGEYVRLP